MIGLLLAVFGIITYIITPAKTYAFILVVVAYVITLVANTIYFRRNCKRR